MSIKVMTLVWDNFKRGGSEKLAMLALADWCNDEGGSLHPSISSIAKKINVSDKQARRIIHTFIDDGYLSVIANHYGGDKGQSRHYQLNISKLLTPPMDVTPPMQGRYPSHAGALPLPPMGAKPPLTIIEPSDGESENLSLTQPAGKLIKRERKSDWENKEIIPSAEQDAPKKIKRTGTLTECPESFCITEEMFEFAASYGYSDEETIEATKRFKRHHLAKGNKFKRWDLAWQNWISGRFTVNQGGAR